MLRVKTLEQIEKQRPFDLVGRLTIAARRAWLLCVIPCLQAMFRQWSPIGQLSGGSGRRRTRKRWLGVIIAREGVAEGNYSTTTHKGDFPLGSYLTSPCDVT